MQPGHVIALKTVKCKHHIYIKSLNNESQVTCSTKLLAGVATIPFTEGGGQSTDMVDESDEVVDVEAKGLRGVLGGDCITRSNKE